MRILFVTPVVPQLDARDGGGRVMAQLVAATAERHAVALACLKGDDETGLDALRSCCDVVEVVERPSSRSGFAAWGRRGRLLRGLIAGTPLWASRWWVPAFARRLRSLVESWQPDVVQLEYHVMGQYAGALGHRTRSKRILVEHDPGVAAAADDGHSKRGLGRVVAAADRFAWKRYERRVFRRVDRVVVFTNRDRDALLPLAGRTPIVRIPIGVSLPPHAFDPLGNDPPTVLFVGSFRHFPNEDAARRLAVDIFPLVRSQCRSARLVIVGSDLPASVKALASPTVDVVGDVPDVAPFLQGAAAVAVPVRLGGGMRVKVLETLAGGKALVCSRRAAEGIGVRDGEHLRVVETDREFAAALAELICDPQRRAGLAVAARSWALANAGWSHTADAYDELYRTIGPSSSAGARARVTLGLDVGRP